MYINHSIVSLSTSTAIVLLVAQNFTATVLPTSYELTAEVIIFKCIQQNHPLQGSFKERGQLLSATDHHL